MLQHVLTDEFGAEFDALVQKVRPRMVELGYATALEKDSVSAEDVTSARGKAKGQAKK